jgi:hypothetical protein
MAGERPDLARTITDHKRSASTQSAAMAVLRLSEDPPAISASQNVDGTVS